MTPERHQEIKRLFLAAVERRPGDIQAFLDGACNGDADLRAEVESMLAHHRTETLLQANTSAETLELVNSALASSDDSSLGLRPIDDNRAPGTLVGGRYRLEVLLGRGGMGSVYRAHDSELDQTIAVKFLYRKQAGDAGAIELLRREVQTARRITHPNVVRIFDIGTADGEPFVTMEFVAGEDLGSLVRRVGPLPPMQVTQIALQLAAGLAAAHRAGILHRDLKPANVMIDSAGNLRILDFGIASALDDPRALRRLSGTPGFVAPEVLDGQLPSERSDLYGWALVVRFAATGAVPAKDSSHHNNADDDRFREAGVSDELAAAVQSCLSPDPAKRLPSSAELVALLSAEDPLGEVLRSGQAPSAVLLAATSSWKPGRHSLHVLLAIGGLLLVAIVLLADQTLFLSRCGLVKSPDALREIAQRMFIDLGYKLPSNGQRIGVTLDTDCLQYIRAHPQVSNAWQQVAAGELPAVFFTYRQGDRRLPSPFSLTANELEQPLPPVATIRLDGRGNLLLLQITEGSQDNPKATQATDWAKLFSLAGLSMPDFHNAETRSLPTVFADDVHHWQGPLPVDANQTLHVTAAARQGRPVYFNLQYPWQWEMAGESSRSQVSHFVAIRRAGWLVAIVLAAAFAWRNAKQGQADWQNARRVAVCVLALAALDWLCGSRHSLNFAQEITAAFDWLLVIVFCSAVAGVTYLAVEPLARRWWPWSIITLRRLLEGRVRDRAIWADLLLGLVVGLGCVLLRQSLSLANRVVGISVSGLNDFDPSQNLLDHFGMRYRFAVLVSALLLAVLQSLLLLTLMIAARRIMKSTLLAAAMVIVLTAALSIVGRGLLSPIDWLARTLLLAIAAGVLLRVGLLASVTAVATYYAVNNAPITLDGNAWYAPTGFACIAILAAALATSWRMASRMARPVVAMP
jgi:protein kinase-like protein